MSELMQTKDVTIIGGVPVAKALSAMFTRDELLKYIYEILKKS